MQRKPLPKISFLLVICACLFSSLVFAQPKPSAEVVVSKCWASAIGDNTAQGLAVDGSRVFLGLGGARIEALSLDGKKMWVTELGGDIRSNMLAVESGLYVITSTVSSETGKNGGSMLRSISKETGITNWTIKMPDADKHFLDSSGGNLFVVSSSGVIQSLGPKTGALKWKREIAEGFAAEPVFDGDKLLVAATAKQIFQISLATGEIDSMQKVPFAVTALGRSGGPAMALGDERGNATLTAFGAVKADWKFRTGGEISTFVFAQDHLLVTSHDNFVYFLGLSGGSLAWKKRLAGRISLVANVLDRYALISGIEEHGVVLVDLTNGKVAGQIAFDESETALFSRVAAGGLVYILTNGSAYSFSMGACPPKNEGGRE